MRLLPEACTKIVQKPREQVQPQITGKKRGRRGLNQFASPPNNNLDNLKSDMDIHTAAFVPHPEPRPKVLRWKSLASGSNSHPPATRPLVNPIGALRPAVTADSVCTPLVRYGSGALAPSHFHQLSPHGPDKHLAVNNVHLDSPAHPAPAEVTQLPDPPAAPPDHCPPSNFELPDGFLPPFFGSKNVCLLAKANFFLRLVVVYYRLE